MVQMADLAAAARDPELVELQQQDKVQTAAVQVALMAAAAAAVIQQSVEMVRTLTAAQAAMAVHQTSLELS